MKSVKISTWILFLYEKLPSAFITKIAVGSIAWSRENRINLRLPFNLNLFCSSWQLDCIPVSILILLLKVRENETYRDPLAVLQSKQWHIPANFGRAFRGTDKVICPQRQAPWTISADSMSIKAKVRQCILFFESCRSWGPEWVKWFHFASQEAYLDLVM